MEMVRGNRAIRDHIADGRSIHLFEYVDQGLVRYIGEATYLAHHIEERPDVNGDTRNAIIFELEVNPTAEAPEVQEAPPTIPKSRSLRLWTRPLEEVKKIATERPSNKAIPVERRAITYQRSEAVRVYVLRRAQGVCESCSEEAPFLAMDNRPYLEAGLGSQRPDI